MHRLAIGVVALGVALTAMAAPASGLGKEFSSTLTPHKHVKVGQKLTLTSTHAKPNLSYGCALTIRNPKTGVAAIDESFSDIKLVTSSSAGHVSCSLTFKKIAEKDSKGHIRHCPLTKKDAKAGFVCGIGIGDVSTSGDTSYSFAKFTAKKSAKP